ncbi:CENP-S associating centromere protein X-domain-containing protein [Lipomyces oligophaga]|uniref:CENP-S associating centromere protein X-domain-containing protein n=1 Tax=Lipomyces oligophaga TaxID=45792 RepID=UPI0034CEA323
MEESTRVRNEISNESNEETNNESRPENPTTFPTRTINRLFSANFKPSTKVSSEALEASAEYLRVFTREAVWRTHQVLESDSATESNGRMLQVSDLEKVAGTLVLDF